jgi:hypothetical protein
VRAGSEPEIALARGRAHNQPQKSTKSTLTPVLPPQLLPTQSTYPQCNAPLPLLPEASPQSSIKMTSPQHKTGCDSRSRCQHQNRRNTNKNAAAASNTTINNNLVGWEGRRAKSRPGVLGKQTGNTDCTTFLGIIMFYHKKTIIWDFPKSMYRNNQPNLPTLLGQNVG